MNKRARQFILSLVKSEDSEGTWRDDTFTFQTNDEDVFEKDLKFLEGHNKFCTVLNSGFMDTHWEIEIKWEQT